ncbi:MAG: hypothetical protein GW748_07495 [Alphaproteobacteria bacterium]|nr:hypothetical protein [Alphaproteobacteria bacterium]NCQ67571.1 hypothetical protein [Alphaproteobacteria bacterium]NCT08343.1 hypothetical protein [Alphaproteobacteria bacterium]
MKPAPVVQLAFDISLDPIYRWENFYISLSNDEAVSLLQRWPRWDNRVQLLYGPSGSGRTHIAHLWRNESRASFVDDSVLKLDYLAEYVCQNPFLIVDNADEISCYKGLFHLYNLINEYQGYLLLTAKTPPRLWNIALPDLASRLQSVPATQIKAPDDDLLCALLIKRFSDLQLKVPENVLNYIIKHMQRSYEGVQEMTTLLNRTSLELRRNLTLPLVKQILDL